MALNRATREFVGVDAQIDSAYDFDPTVVMVERVSDGTNVRLIIWQISTGSAVNPGSGTTYDAAPLGSVFIDNVGLHYRKAAASTWTSF